MGLNIQLIHLEGYASLDLTVKHAAKKNNCVNNSFLSTKAKMTRFKKHILVSSYVYEHRFCLCSTIATEHQLQPQLVGTFFFFANLITPVLLLSARRFFFCFFLGNCCRLCSDKIHCFNIFAVSLLLVSMPHVAIR